MTQSRIAHIQQRRITQQDELRNKLDPKAEKCIFVGYSIEQKGYKCYNPVTRELRVSRDVVFDEMAS